MNRYISAIYTISALLISLLSLNLLTPKISVWVPNDYFRTKIILDSLQDSSFNPTIVVLGDSKGMSGVNCSYVEGLFSKERVRNLCSPGQTLVESALYYPYLPESVHTVIQCIHTRDFNQSALHLTDAAYTAFASSGFIPNEDVKAIVGESVYNKFDVPILIRNFKCRILLKSGLSNFLLRTLDDDPPTDRMESLVYPYPYPSDKAPTYDRDLAVAEKYSSEVIERFVLLDEVKMTLRTSNEYFGKKGIRYVLLITPTNKGFKTAEGANELFSQDLNSEFGEFELINSYLSLEAEDFYDMLHPNTQGALKQSQDIVNYLLNNK